MVARSIRGHVEATSFADQTIVLVREKLFQKEYRTLHPMEVLAHGNDMLLPDDVWEPSYARRLKDLFHASHRLPTQRFQRLWVANLGRRSKSHPIWLVHPPLDT